MSGSLAPTVRYGSARTSVPHGPGGALPGVAGYCAATYGAGDCAEDGALWGLVGGMLAVDLFDALVLAYDDAPPEKNAYLPLVTFGPRSVALAGYW